MELKTAAESARAFLAGKQLTVEEASRLAKTLKNGGDISLARRVLERIRKDRRSVIGSAPDARVRRTLCQQEALLTSTDLELNAARRHDRAIEILEEGIALLTDPVLDGDSETLGIAGGILKRRWADFGQIADLRLAGTFYDRGALSGLGEDGYALINAAFVDDLLAQAGDAPTERRERAQSNRQFILDNLPRAEAVSPGAVWFNAATRAEALVGLRRYGEAADVLEGCAKKPAPWQLETTARQIARLVHLQQENPLAVPEIRRLFDALLPGAPEAVQSVVNGKVGLALSGGGFRASFYHLGVLARLAELNVLRHVEVLSCVSGGSIVGMCYWLALRSRMMQGGPLTHQDYVAVVQRVIQQFLVGVEGNLRGAVQPKVTDVIWNILRRDQKGALDPEATAKALQELFFQPLLQKSGEWCMHDLPFTPTDHDSALTNSSDFHPGRHNWLRANKVPVLVLNATTVNTGHAWQFTPTWMGESPWAVHEAADSIPRLEWSWYEARAGWKITVGQAVAASASVPGVFAPLEIKDAYNDVDVQLVDGGVHDNQGTVSLLALNCNVLIVSDACGQLMLEKKTATGLGGLLGYAGRAMTTLMERVRLANYAELAARQRFGLIRGLMFLHMKAGLDADTIRLRFSQAAYDLQRSPLSPSGVRKDFQQLLSELRTDLDAFTPTESHLLMACGYQMASWAYARDLGKLTGLAAPEVPVDWVFKPMLEEITSTAATTPRRDELLAALRTGNSVRL